MGLPILELALMCRVCGLRFDAIDFMPQEQGDLIAWAPNASERDMKDGALDRFCSGRLTASQL